MNEPAKLEIERKYLVEIDYSNYQGKREWRTVYPLRLDFSANEWHPEPQWLLHAIDVRKNAIRFFAMRDIHQWKPAS